jgi:two-component system cell cycle sensor histidine kinase/response regulator CckA
MTTDHRPIVLVIDDDTAVRKILAAMIERSGYVARLAASGDEGVMVYRRHQDEIAAVVLDVRMPEKDGPHTLVELRRVNPALPCVFVTGYSPEYSHEELVERGAVVLPKPVVASELARALRAASRPAGADPGT